MMLLDRFWRGAVRAAEAPSQTFFYEAVTSKVIGPLPPSFGYPQREAFTADVRDQIVPRLLAAVDVAPSVETQLSPGGYELHTNPSLQTHIVLDDAAAQVVGAALGWVFRQESVLVADLRDREEGHTAYAIVDLGSEPLTYEAAHRFFLHANSVHGALGQGYTAFLGDMLFLNLGDLDDASYLDALRRSAETFAAPATFLTDGIADARFVWNDWTTQPDGEDYAKHLSEAVRAQLAPLRDLHADLLREHTSR